MDFEKARENMVKTQLLSRGITSERVIEAFRAIPRECFVPERLREFAYQDGPLSIGNGQTISQPYIVALMTELLDVQPTDKILEIGTGSGYQTAILAYLGRQVYTVERIAELQELAKKRLTSLGFDNINYKIDDGSLGWEEFAKYDKIIVTAGAPDIPEALVDQLKLSGILVIPVGNQNYQRLKRIKKLENGLLQEDFGGCVFVPLVGRQGW